jgi:hypothetical protein
MFYSLDNTNTDKAISAMKLLIGPEKMNGKLVEKCRAQRIYRTDEANKAIAEMASTSSSGVITLH